MKRSRILAALALSTALVAAGCGGTAEIEPDDAQGEATPGEQEADGAEQDDDEDAGEDDGGEGDGGEAGSGAQLDADGVLEPGEVVAWELEQPVTYYSMGVALGDHGKDDVQTVTVEDAEYIDKPDLPADAEPEDLGDGVLVLTVSWEGVAGSVQSNNGYIKARLDSNPEEHAHYKFFREDNLQNGDVPIGTTETGTFTYIIDRGPTTITLEDYTVNPIAHLHIDTSK